MGTKPIFFLPCQDASQQCQGHARLPAEKLQATEGAMWGGGKAGVSFLALWGLEGRDPLLLMVCPSLLPWALIFRARLFQ